MITLKLFLGILMCNDYLEIVYRHYMEFIFLGLFAQAATFWRCIDTSEADDEADDSGALAAVGCLRAISTILESVSSLPHLFVQIEPTLLPIMRKMLTTDGQGTYFPCLHL